MNFSKTHEYSEETPFNGPFVRPSTTKILKVEAKKKASKTQKRKVCLIDADKSENREEKRIRLEKQKEDAHLIALAKKILAKPEEPKQKAQKPQVDCADLSRILSSLKNKETKHVYSQEPYENDSFQGYIGYFSETPRAPLVNGYYAFWGRN
ncbi:hypothetical protein L596_006816 [Steinernema carpocapsae]|uniref:Uncharacterized protein n=1 Tax=Steinernema carpocapsae TaxID=34508 RepID=A0A4U5P7N6_STECR|nr:hypothetical protein L596_006816 [Steinernema carpocapsae]